MSKFDRDVLPLAAATAAARMDEANEAHTDMEQAYREAVLAIRIYNDRRGLYLAAHEAAIVTTLDVADAADAIAETHRPEPAPPEIPDPDPSQPTPTVAAAAAAELSIRRRRAA